MRKQFDIKYRPQIESGEYKVETRDGRRARIICWDAIGPFPIIGLFLTDDGGETTTQNRPDGRWCDDLNYESDYDLFIVTPEEEMSEFEKEYCRLYKEGYADGQAGSEQLSDAVLKTSASELLSLAREQFINYGYVIKKKAFHDAVESISDKHLAEMSVQYSVHCKVEDGTRHAVLDWSEFQKVAQKFIDIGRAEAVSDIPESNF